jgi:drug/metabolite transporter (DMT)-like permease
MVLWSFLAPLGARLTHLPPLLMTGLALCAGGLVGLPRLRDWRVPFPTYLVGLAGIFGYHFLYFSAFRLAPVLEANLINYLWPLLIVLLSPVILPGWRLRPHHLLGALLGFSGAGLIATGGRLRLDENNLPGYLLMAGAALAWAVYSLLTRRLPRFPTSAVGGFCLGAGLLSLGLYYAGNGADGAAFRQGDALLLLLAGAGPMGAAFYTWDAALKRGDPRILGALAYLIPLSSTLLLVVFAGQRLTWISALAMLLIVSGALLGSLDFLRPTRLSTAGHELPGS